MSSDPRPPAGRVHVPAVLLGLLVLLTPAAAAADLDPGTTGLVVGSLGAALAWGALVLVFLRKKLVALLRFLAQLLSRHRLAAAAVALALAGGGVAAAHLGGLVDVSANTLSTGPGSRVLILGVDGADPKMVGELLDQGLLPNMKRLADAGAFRSLQIPNPAESPVIWASMATGQNPGRTGLFDFIARDPARYQPALSLLQPSGSGYRYPIRAKAFWDLTAEAGLPTTIVRWPSTFPPERIQGRMLAGLGVPDVRGSLGRYTYYTDREPEPGAEGSDRVTRVELEGGQGESVLAGPQVRSLGGVKALTVPVKIRVDPAQRRALVTVGSQSVAVAEGEFSDWVELSFGAGLFSKYRGLVKLYLHSAAEPFGLLATSVEMHPDAPVVAFSQPKDYAAQLREEIGLYHTMGMPEDTRAYGDGRMSEAAFLRLCKVVDDERRAMLMAELGRFEKGVLAVVFDGLDRIQHMTPEPAPAHLATSAAGQYLLDFDAFLGKVLDRVGKDTPVVLVSDHGFARFDQAVDLNRFLVEAGELGLDEAGWRARPAGSSGELFKHVAWDRTRAYAVGFAGLYVNLEGREARGTVAPGQRAQVAEEIAQKLERLRDPDTGARVFHKVYRRDDLYRGPQVEHAPDVVVGFESGYRGSWQTAVGGLAEAVFSPNTKLWQRDHIVDASLVPGVLLTNVPVQARRPHVYDVAPTVLSLLGVPVPAEMEGRPLHLSGASEDVSAAQRERGGEERTDVD